jgi:hypothetical protein
VTRDEWKTEFRAALWKLLYPLEAPRPAALALAPVSFHGYTVKVKGKRDKRGEWIVVIIEYPGDSPGWSGGNTTTFPLVGGYTPESQASEVAALLRLKRERVLDDDAIVRIVGT